MSKTLSQKKNDCEKITEILKNNHACLLLQYETITGDEFSDFRKMIHKTNGEIFCVKKSLLKRVLNDPLKSLGESEGSLMIISSNNEIETMNVIRKAMKKIIGFNICNSMLNNQILTVKNFNELSKLTSEKDLKGATLTHIRIPMLRFVDVLEKIAAKK